MKTRAAVAWEANKPLTIETIDIGGPKSGEVLVEIMATGVCHTDAYTLSGLDSEGKFPAILGHEGAGIVREVGAGVTSVKPGDHVIPLYTPECRGCKTCLSQRSNLCTAIRGTQGQGLMPDQTTRFSCEPVGGRGRNDIFHYMGCSTFSNFTVLPEIAVAKVREDAPFDKICYIGCGVTTGLGAVIWTAKVWPGANVVVFGLGGIGLNVIQGARMVGADKIIGIDLNPAKAEMAKKFGMTHFINPMRSAATRSCRRSSISPGRRRLLLRVHRQCPHHAPGAGMLPSRLGREHHHRRRAVGTEISTRPFQLVTGRVWKGSAFGGARGRTDVPKIVDWYMEGKIDIDSLITHTMPLDEINTAFDLMHEGKSIRSVVTF